MDFNPRPPRGERPDLYERLARYCDISIHALREESDVPPSASLLGHFCISIHALREESDKRERLVAFGVEISIHALREEGD